MKLRRIRGEMYSSFRMLRVKNCNHKYIIFKGKRSVNWKDAREYLKKYVGEFYTIASTGDVVYVGSDLPCEYSGSLYTKKLNGTVAKAKANATQGIPELLEIAVGKHLERIVEISMIGMPNMVGIGMICIFRSIGNLIPLETG